MRILVMGTLDDTESQVVAKSGDGIGSVPSPTVADDRPDLVLCLLERRVAAIIAAIERHGSTPPVTACGGCDQPGARGRPPLPATADQVTTTPDAIAPCPEPIRMIAHDPSMVALMRRVDQVAPSGATVLITGESGSGKELVAARLHQASGRRGRFVAFNCASASDTMLERELFGHEEGAFPGATSCRVGKFETADGGTLLLDEVGEMDLRMQAKLLRAIQEREIGRIGGSRTMRVDVRIVATTNCNLKEEVRRGRFRADLFFRLNVVTLGVPALRRRPDDIAPLAESFVRRFAAANARPATSLSQAAVAMLRRHSWPGNVRELENVIQRAVLSETGPEIDVASLDVDAFGTTVAVGLAADPAQARRDEGAHLGTIHTAGRTIEAVERDMILDTLQQNLGNRTKTASVLGISIRTLRNKLHEYERGGIRIPRPIVVGIA